MYYIYILGKKKKKWMNTINWICQSDVLGNDCEPFGLLVGSCNDVQDTLQRPRGRTRTASVAVGHSAAIHSSAALSSEFHGGYA